MIHSHGIYNLEGLSKVHGKFIFHWTWDTTVEISDTVNSCNVVNSYIEDKWNKKFNLDSMNLVEFI